MEIPTGRWPPEVVTSGAVGPATRSRRSVDTVESDRDSETGAQIGASERDTTDGGSAPTTATITRTGR